jgi:hypothetical protein
VLALRDQPRDRPGLRPRPAGRRTFASKTGDANQKNEGTKLDQLTRLRNPAWFMSPVCQAYALASRRQQVPKSTSELDRIVAAGSTNLHITNSKNEVERLDSIELW